MAPRRQLTHAEFLAALQAAVDAAGGQRPFAAMLGVTPGYLSQIVTGHRPPSERVLTALGYRRVDAYERI
jgi:transcriptional regulator with XRE-family HTH domain